MTYLSLRDRPSSGLVTSALLRSLTLSIFGVILFSRLGFDAFLSRPRGASSSSLSSSACTPALAAEVTAARAAAFSASNSARDFLSKANTLPVVAGASPF